jgi:galactonate dehydratase
MSVAPHNPLGPLATAAAIHFAAATPNWIIQESLRADVPWRDEVLINPVQIAGGYVALPESPGLGVAVNEAAAAKHPFVQEDILRYFHPDAAVADW